MVGCWPWYSVCIYYTSHTTNVEPHVLYRLMIPVHFPQIILVFMVHVALTIFGVVVDAVEGRGNAFWFWHLSDGASCWVALLLMVMKLYVAFVFFLNRQKGKELLYRQYGGFTLLGSTHPTTTKNHSLADIRRAIYYIYWFKKPLVIRKTWWRQVSYVASLATIGHNSEPFPSLRHTFQLFRCFGYQVRPRNSSWWNYSRSDGDDDWWGMLFNL